MTKYPSNKKYKRKPALFPKAPLVAVFWYDACFDSYERIEGEPDKDYLAGCPDTVVGFYLGVRDDCVLISHSVYVRGGKDKHRHIWNIPCAMIIKIQELTPKRVKSK